MITLERIARLLQINGYEKILHNSDGNFSTLLTYRLSLFQIESYSDTHYLNMEKMTKNKRKEIKQILKDGKRLHEDVMNYLLK